MRPVEEARREARREFSLKQKKGRKEDFGNGDWLKVLVCWSSSTFSTHLGVSYESGEGRQAGKSSLPPF